MRLALIVIANRIVIQESDIRALNHPAYILILKTSHPQLQYTSALRAVQDVHLMRFHHNTRALYLKPYLKQFEAVVLRGGVGDYVQFDMYNEESLGYFLRSGVTHFGLYTCDCETGDYDDGAAKFASGKIEVWVGDDGKVGVSGKATCDDVSMDNTFRHWELMERINNELESIATHDDRPVACIRLQHYAPALSRPRTIFKSEQPFKWFGKRYLVLIRSVPSTTHHQTLFKRCSVPSNSPQLSSEIDKSSASFTSAPSTPGQHVLTATGPSNAFLVFYEFERPKSGTLNTSPLAMQRRFGYQGCRSSSSGWL
ncbi:hypothetical protein M436DRAFT_64223 [Aureobasidium namibiae CBS 147.97]|uniref:Uncharacterized protein n=1 Tax=Aureobasidium namibiae CBS 147.97 TaxID=1043004 RepID=A0A074WNA3_9PEZI|nr:uncharacterized protein M436DRAFT_64223 [Aureobasidium namibiae CBS 147.97]KEQ73064.1 hypothetical protein M436DRAFT_64223 [Aureobasidium namibiae CBS 147.97]